MKRLPLIPTTLLFCVALPAFAQPAEVAKTLCDGRPDCQMIWAKPAGEDPQKRPLTVVDLGLAGDVDYEAPQISGECNPHEIWLVVGDKEVVSRQLITTLCNDGYGSRGMGEDIIEVKPNRLHLRKTGGSSWMWNASWEIELSPKPRIVSEGTSGWWTLGDHSEQNTWSHDDFHGRSSWSAPTCADKSVMRGGQYAPIPIPVVRDDWDWRTTALAECSLHLTSADDPKTRGGGVVHGSRATSGDSSLRVLGISDQEFVLEIRDDTFHTSSKSWVKRDHVEVWVGERQGYMDHCLEKGTTSQWGIMLDGDVIPAHGRPKKEPKVAVVRDGNTLRMHVKLPEPAAMITFVYSDSDDGKEQERLIATSALTFGKNHTLGRTRRIPQEDAICRLKDAALVVRRPQPQSTKPLVTW